MVKSARLERPESATLPWLEARRLAPYQLPTAAHIQTPPYSPAAFHPATPGSIAAYEALVNFKTHSMKDLLAAQSLMMASVLTRAANNWT
jgi:hypothetical protein